MNCSKCGAENPDDAAFCKVCGNNLKLSAPVAGASPPSPGSSPMGKATFQMSTAITNAIALVTNPVGFIKENKDAAVPVNTLLINYVAVLAAIPFIATLIGDLWYYAFRFYGYAILEAIVTYILDVAAVFVIGFVIWKLAPSFGTTTNQAKATMLAAFAYTPVFLISILNIIPFIGWISILGLLYGLYILYLGIPVVLGTPADKAVPYLVVIVIAAIIVFVVIGAIVAAITAAFFVTAFYYF